MVYQHNASSSLEHHCISLIERHLTKLKYPNKRLPIEVIFDYSLRTFAASKIRLIEPVTNPLKGFVELRLNSLCLVQSPSAFFRDCIAHQLAHILCELEAKKKGNPDVKRHGFEWQNWLSKLASEATPSSSGPNVFDMRASILHKGGVPCACKCGSLAGFHVVPNSTSALAKLDNNEMSCENCQSHITLVSVEEIPEKIKKELLFISEMICQQQHLTPLHRLDLTH